MNKDKIRLKAFKEAAQRFGGVVKYAKALGVERARVSHWVNSSGINAPFEYCLLTAFYTGISVDRLSPSTPEANKVVNLYFNVVRLMLIKFSQGCASERKGHTKGVFRVSKPKARASKG